MTPFNLPPGCTLRDISPERESHDCIVCGEPTWEDELDERERCEGCAEQMKEDE